MATFTRRLCNEPMCNGCLARALLMWYQMFGPLSPTVTSPCPDCGAAATESHEEGCLIQFTEKALKHRGLL